MRTRAAITGAFLLLVVAPACGGDDEGTVTGNDRTIAATVNNGVVSVPVSVEGTKALPFIVDTGSVLTRIDTNVYDFLLIGSGLVRLNSLQVGNLELMNVEVLSAGLCGMMLCRSGQPAGLLGGAILVAAPFTIDYRGATVTFGASPPPLDNVAAALTAPFALEGGGQGMVAGEPVDLPATRISVEVDVEGRTLRMIIDTGSTAITLRPDVYDAIVADGRAQSTIHLNTVLGTTDVPRTTLSSVSLAGATQADVEAVRSPLDMTVLEDEVGHPVDGLLGGAFLQSYVTTIDGPSRTITLLPYL